MAKYSLFLLLLITGCASTTNLSQSGGYSYYGIDFREYTEKGFQFTPEKPSGSYESIGIVEVTFEPEVREVSITTYNTKGELGILKGKDKTFVVQKAFLPSGVKYYAVEKIDIDKSIKEVYKLANEWGANAIVNFSISTNTSTNYIIKESVSVNGFAIKK
ncbi:MAG: hypothetical protein FH748_11820 [Balneolaceae bacterium]|nr:hypothetical protein [Balneolaceae bacterium]